MLGQNLFINEYPNQIDHEDGLLIYLRNAVHTTYIHTMQRPKSRIKLTIRRLRKVELSTPPYISVA
jgi:hypothetical protein